MEHNYLSEISYWLAILVKMRPIHVIWMRKKEIDLNGFKSQILKVKYIFFKLFNMYRNVSIG